MKAQGAKKVAALGYGISPSSSEAAKSLNKYAVPAVGLEAVYTNTTVDFGSTDVGPLVLGIKNAGADAAFYAMNGNTNLAIAQGLKQNGVKMKAQLMATGYGQSLLDQPIADQLGPSVIFTQGWAPVEAKTKATKKFQADLKKYADFTGVPDFGDLHRLHRLRPGHHRAEGAGQEPRPEHLRRRPAQARQGQPRPASAASPSTSASRPTASRRRRAAAGRRSSRTASSSS